MNDTARRLIVVALSVALVGELVWLAQPTFLTSLLPASSSSPVTVANIALYGSMRYPDCRPISRAATSFPATNMKIYDREVFTAWHGSHTMTIQYVEPSGRVYAVSHFKGHSLSTACGYISVNGDEAAALPGRWQLRFSVGGHSIRSKSFSIRRVGPDPQRLVPTFICRRGCAASIRAFQGATMHARFSGRTALIQYLRRHPGDRILMIVGGTV